MCGELMDPLGSEDASLVVLNWSKALTAGAPMP